MPDPLNPYREWLDLSLDRPPANHYELLGLAPIEDDLEAIAHQSDVLIARVRSIRPGQNLAQWQQLLDELLAAKFCLTTPSEKTAYDKSLQKGAAEKSPARQSVERPAPPWGSAPTLATPPTSVHSDTSSDTPQRKELPRSWDEIKNYASNSIPTASRPSTPPPAQLDSPPAQLDSPPAQLDSPPSATPTRGADLPKHPAQAADPSQATQFANEKAPPQQGVVGYGLSNSENEAVAPASPVVRRTKRPNATLAALAGRVILLALLGGLLFMLYTIIERHQLLALSDKDPNQSVAGASSNERNIPAGNKNVDPTQPPSENSTERATPPTESTQETPTEVTASNVPTAEQTPDEVDNVKPKGEDSNAETSNLPTDPHRQAAFRQSVSDARFALSEHDIESAKAHLNLAATKAQSPAEQSELDRVDQIAGHLAEFWRGMSQAVASLHATETIKIGETYIVVVESSESHLIVKATGRVRQFQLEEIPASLIRILADLRLGKDSATQTLLGVYLAVDPDGDKAEARRIWQQAGKDGIDVRDLLAELDSFGKVSPDGSPTQSSSQSLPSKATLAPLLDQVRQQFQEEYRLATNASGKEELAARLLGAARAVLDQPDLRFAMLQEAHDMAIASGKPMLACGTIDELAKSHAIDVVAMKIDALEKIARTARGITRHRAIVQQLIPMIEASIQAKHPKESRRLVDIAKNSAKKSLNRPLMQQMMAFDQQVTAMESQPKGGARR